MSKMLTPAMYDVDTGLFTEEEIESADEAIVDIDIPEWIVRAYYEANPKFAKDTARELRIPVEEATFERWYTEVYVADDMDGLCTFARMNGFEPARYEAHSVPVTVHSVYDHHKHENVDFGLNDEGYNKAMFAMESSDKYLDKDEERYEYFGVDTALHFVWRMTPWGFNHIRHKEASPDIFAEIHVGTIKVEIKCAGGGYDIDNIFPIEQTFVWGIEDPAYGYEFHGTPYKYLDDVFIDIPVRRSRSGFETAFEQSFINFLNKNPEWIKEAIKETVVDNWY